MKKENKEELIMFGIQIIFALSLVWFAFRIANTTHAQDRTDNQEFSYHMEQAMQEMSIEMEKNKVCMNEIGTAGKYRCTIFLKNHPYYSVYFGYYWLH